MSKRRRSAPEHSQTKDDKSNTNADCSQSTQNLPISTATPQSTGQPHACENDQKVIASAIIPTDNTSVISAKSCSDVPQPMLSSADISNAKTLKKRNTTANLLEEIELHKFSFAINNRKELNDEEKRSILADFDAGMLPHEIEEKYGITDILPHSASISRTSWSDLFAFKKRRTVYVSLNKQMWDYFCQCRKQKIWLNGRQLKEQALKIAHELGLCNFKASEGWLDSFKRRHCIDLKAMTGKPVVYETDFEEAISLARSTSSGQSTNSISLVSDTKKFVMNVGVSSSPANNELNLSVPNKNHAAVAFRTTNPLDFQQLLSAGFRIDNTNVSTPGVEKSEMSAKTVQALIETCCHRVDEIEVAQAVDTLRAYIVTNNISLLPLLVELQKNLAAIASRHKTNEPTNMK